MAEAETAEAVLAWRLRWLRDRRRLTQEQLAATEGLTLSPSAINRIEGGKRGVSVQELLDLAAALNVSPLLLLPRDGQPWQDLLFVQILGKERFIGDVRGWIDGTRPLSDEDDAEQWSAFQLQRERVEAERRQLLRSHPTLSAIHELLEKVALYVETPRALTSDRIQQMRELADDVVQAVEVHTRQLERRMEQEAEERRSGRP